MLGITAAAISSEPMNRVTLGRRRSADPDRVDCAAVRARSEPFNSCAKRIAIGAPLAAGVKLKPLTRSCPNGVRVNRLLPVVSPVSDVTVEPKLTKWTAVTAVTVNRPVTRGLSPVSAIGPPRAPRSTSAASSPPHPRSPTVTSFVGSGPDWPPTVQTDAGHGSAVRSVDGGDVPQRPKSRVGVFSNGDGELPRAAGFGCAESSDRDKKTRKLLDNSRSWRIIKRSTRAPTPKT